MTKMGSEPPLFDRMNFFDWKSRMGAYLDALGPDVWNDTKIGYAGALTPEQQKWNTKARNTIIEGISEDVFGRIDNIDLAHFMWLQLIQLHEGLLKFVNKSIICLELNMMNLRCFQMSVAMTCFLA
jgi:hypothetical protein